MHITIQESVMHTGKILHCQNLQCRQGCYVSRNRVYIGHLIQIIFVLTILICLMVCKTFYAIVSNIGNKIICQKMA